jgi:hypothetical protein
VVLGWPVVWSGDEGEICLLPSLSSCGRSWPSLLHAEAYHHRHQELQVVFPLIGRFQTLGVDGVKLVLEGMALCEKLTLVTGIDCH